MHSGWPLRAFHLLEALAQRWTIHLVVYAESEQAAALQASPVGGWVAQLVTVASSEADHRSRGDFPIWDASAMRRLAHLLGDRWPSHVRGWYSAAYEARVH
ncbi:MAG: hypothetical protein MUE41_16715, partial [Gemmatimonadaceae bacterium]|nr:hypothetical protein [Gemmatimonadaceae bacterium]